MSVHSLIPYLGEVIAGRYQLESMLGQGGAGLVYAARDNELDRRVAIKLSWAYSEAQSDGFARIQREARVASTLHHPGAVAVHDFGSSGGRLYLVMELLEGESLAERLGRLGQLDCAEVARIAYCIGDALAAAHDAAIVHRDLKPANVFVDHQGQDERVVVLDFGLAFSLDSSDDSVGRLTEGNMTIGTPFYMSPEQIRDSDLGPASDIYSLGCVLFELLTGRSPFHDQSPAKVLSDHLYTPAPRASDYRPDIPAALDQLIARILEKNLADRPTAAALCDELADFDPARHGRTPRVAI